MRIQWARQGVAGRPESRRRRDLRRPELRSVRVWGCGALGGERVRAFGSWEHGEHVGMLIRGLWQLWPRWRHHRRIRAIGLVGDGG